jgi:succinate dehydrogenase / fumarate reductase cytochrome b subunit
MRYAFWPGCVSKAGTPELYPAATAVAAKVGMELVELDQANCTGAGVLGERNEELVDTLNARNFAIAEQQGLDTLLTICSTCQGVMSSVNYKLREKPEYLAKINENLRAEGLEYKGTVRVTHMMWAMVEEIGLDELKGMVVNPLHGVKVAPFYGCYVLRPRYVLGFDEHPDRGQYLEKIIETLGAEPIDYDGKWRCCGFPIMTINESNGLRMVANHTLEAKDKGAHVMVTPCPLCHINLDEFQPKAKTAAGRPINMPVLHLPQMIGAAIGFNAKDMGLKRHIISTEPFIKMSGVPRG